MSHTIIINHTIEDDALLVKKFIERITFYHFRCYISLQFTAMNTFVVVVVLAFAHDGHGIYNQSWTFCAIVSRLHCNKRGR